MRSHRPSIVRLLAPAVILVAGCAPAPAASGALHGVVEIQQVHVASRVGGRVAETLAVEGALLEAGDPIARLAAPELAARRDEAAAAVAAESAALDRARAGPRREEVEAARAYLEASRARLALLRAGPRPEETRAAAAELAAVESDLGRAEEDLKRLGALLESAVVTRDEVDAARAVRDRLRARRDEAAARSDLLAAGARTEEIDEAAAEARRREAELALLEAGTRAEDIAAAEARVAAARARLAMTEVDLEECLVVAPEAAVLEVLAVRAGDVLAPGAPVARLHRAADLWVKVFVPETDLGRVPLGQAATVTVDSFPGRAFQGTVAWIASQAEFTPRNVQSADERRHQVFAVKVRVEDPDGIFKSGMAADVVLDAVPASR